MKRKAIIIFLVLEAFVCLLFSINGVSSSDSTFMSLTTFPFSQISDMLRKLSLSGNIGNIFAFIIFILIGIIPITVLLVILLKKKFKIEDTLLALIGALIYINIYLMINPSYLSDLFVLKDLAVYGKMTLGVTFYSVFIGYLVLRFVRVLSSCDTSKLLKYFNILLFCITVVLVYVIFGAQVNSLMLDMNSVTNGNTDTSFASQIFNLNTVNSSVITTNIFLIIFYIINQLPVLFDIFIVFTVKDLVDELSIDRYSEGVVIAANRLSLICKISIVVSMLAYIIVNIAQLIFSKNILKINVSTSIPLIPIALMLIVLLLAKYFAQSNKMKQDIDLFV